MSTLWHNWLLYSPALLEGAWLTLRLCLAALAIALVLGVAGALARISKHRAVRALGTAYVEIFRGTPVLIQLYLANFLVVGWLQDTYNLNPDSFLVGVLTLGVNYGAYMTEVYRAGILAVDGGQAEAATSLGMRPARIFRRIVFPQAVRVIIPPLANNLITLIQDSSYLSLIALVDLTEASESRAAGADAATHWQINIFAACLYFLLCYPVSLAARAAERRLQRRSA